MSTIGEYTILPLTLPPTPAFPQAATHTLYIRPHKPNIPTDDDSRSLFVVNVPIDSTPIHFRAVFSSLLGAGAFESITFSDEKRKAPTEIQPLPIISTKNKKRKRETKSVEIDTALPQVWDRRLHKSGSTAVITLVDEKSVQRTLKAIRKLHKSSKSSWPLWGEGTEGKVPPLGSARYASHHKLRYPDKAALQASVDAFMTSFNDAEEEKARLAKKARNVPDEDGFVTVSRGCRVGPARMERVLEKKGELEEREKKKREGMEGTPFYRFQMRGRRKEEQGELVRAFEEDRKRVEGMREKRGRFRPEG